MLGTAAKAAAQAAQAAQAQADYAAQLRGVQGFPMRKHALEAALATDTTGDPDEIIKAAERFHAFLMSAALPVKDD